MNRNNATALPRLGAHVLESRCTEIHELLRRACDPGRNSTLNDLKEAKGKLDHLIDSMAEEPSK